MCCSFFFLYAQNGYTRLIREKLCTVVSLEMCIYSTISPLEVKCWFFHRKGATLTGNNFYFPLWLSKAVLIPAIKQCNEECSLKNSFSRYLHFSYCGILRNWEHLTASSKCIHKVYSMDFWHNSTVLESLWHTMSVLIKVIVINRFLMIIPHNSSFTCAIVYVYF